MSHRPLFRAQTRNVSRFRNAKRAAIAVMIAAALLALPVASQQAKGPKTQVWLDVATHSMAGMPDMSSGMGGMAMRMFGGEAAQNHYGATRFGALPGQYLDVALLNQLNPGAEAEDQIPAGLQLGKTLPLVPPKALQSSSPDKTYQPGMNDRNAKARILIYWGCGTTVRPGQPREIKFEMKDGKVSGNMAQWGSVMQGRYAPDRTVNVDPKFALWPNERMHKMVPKGASLVGNHKIAGVKVPNSLQFDLTQQQDFMPQIALSSSGSLDAGQTWSWRPVDRATGYFLHAMGAQGDAMVFWSSSEVADAGMGIFDYLPPATVDKWIKDKVLLSPGVTQCAMPKGMFAAAGGQPGGGVMQMIAFGPESNITYPPKPSNPKEAWNPEWNVRVRNKSTTTAMLGMSVAATEADQQQQQPPAQEESKTKRLLKGLFGH